MSTDRSADDAALADLSADEALPRLLDTEGHRIYNLALRLCGSPEDADDLVQDVFLQAFRKWHQFEGDSSPSTWLYTIAARACMRNRRLRAGQPKHMASLSELQPSAAGQVLDLPTDEDSPLEDQIRREAMESIERALATLPTPFRMALVLKDIVELPVADVAKILGIRPATVKTRVHRSRLRLRQALLDETSLPHKEAPPPLYSQRVCLDLLRAKQEALDRGAPFRVPQDEVCRRCESLFATLDLTRDTCHLIGVGRMPGKLQEYLLAAFRSEDRA